ncbi:Ras-related small GTP-binding family protein isoform 1 [Hibiscus syriacus]|uniref:Ras-related small GTP-binding family protein isoform 1 n=1 Tax=Hibiscus syriacus TaxID=106335 RepID=A0A6A3D4V0_HIBSY|nr:Ras-related small GTP-binding family protein isoform 1 [Hibiscus syriacus]
MVEPMLRAATGNEVRYKTIQSVLGDDKPTAENADAEISPHMNETTTDFIRDHNDEDTKQVENSAEKADNTVVTKNPWQKTVSQASSLADTGTSAGSSSLKLASNVRKVAFVPVKRPASSTGNQLMYL